MLFANLFKLTTAATVALTLLAFVVSLPTTSAQYVNIGTCYQTKHDTSCGKSDAFALGYAKGTNVLPYNNCYAFKTNYRIIRACADVQCTDCGPTIDRGPGTCNYFNDAKPLRCVIFG